MRIRHPTTISVIEITKLNSGAKVTDHYFTLDGTIYALAELRLDALLGSIQKSSSILRAIRQYSAREGRRTWTELWNEDSRNQRG